MRLLTGLILRVVGIVVVCLVCASVWVLIDVQRSIQAEATASADRVVREARELAWRELTWRGSSNRDAKYAFPDWRSSETLRVISPGYCVSLAWEDEAPRQLCGGWSNVGAAPPAWFTVLFRAVFGQSEPITRPLILQRRHAGTVVAVADHGAAARQAWRMVSVVVGVSTAMAGAMGLLLILVIGHALMPAERIVRGLRRLERGDHTLRLPAFRAREFALIARAVNDLTQRLAETTAQRAALTRKLFQVQEEERRTLARDLHDEFGQCLTAAGALAASVVAGTEHDRTDIAEDVTEIGGIIDRMMGTLRSTLSRLRPPDLDELGLERSLDHLIATWNARGMARMRKGTAVRAPVFRLDIVGSLAEVPTQTSLSLYRIAQECLTNAARHGQPSEVCVRVEHRSAADSNDARLHLIVEDNGGGDPAWLENSHGHGVLGIRERISALGGQLSIGAAERAERAGVRIVADIPMSDGALMRCLA